MKKEAKHIAGISLGVMGVGFAATLPVAATAWGAFLQGGFEAGVVGGLADWFAVSALFRHPLGIPIPHTALLPRNREKITRALVHTVENELLSKATIRMRLEQIPFLSKALELAEAHLESQAVRSALVFAAKQALKAVDPQQLAPWLAEAARSGLQELDTERLLQGVVAQVQEQAYDAKAFDFVLDKVDGWALKRETRDQLGGMAIKAFEGLQAGGFMQFAVNAFIGMLSEEKIGGILQNFILSYTEQLRTSGHPRRTAVLGYIRQELDKLGEQPQLLSELERLKEKLPDMLALDEKLEALLRRLLDKAEAFVDSPEFAERYALPAVRRVLASVRDNEERLQAGESWVREQILDYVEHNHGKIGQLVKENLDKLDNDKLIEMMEDRVGKDLQWIRVNGAICGFLIGLGLAGLKLLF
ncbi:DUF445 domain-containing protein [Paenibacillus athensensis]|nr:DUF445 domain-containing protein [Paenibacillus athensensis]MCD1259599.1 DUF445 domain-containing protein [Paenibacillus athensensis]